MKKMFKHLTLIALFVTNFNLLFAQEENKYYEVTSDAVNIRTEPNANSEIAGKLQQKDVVELIQFTDDWANISFKDLNGETKQGFVKSEFITKQITDTELEQKPMSPFLKYTFLSLLIFSFICYIIAMIKARNNSMIVIANWYDFTLLVFPFISLFLAFITANNENPAVPIVILIIGGLCFCGSIVYSFIANKGNAFNIIVSIFAKLFVLLIVVLSLLYIFRGKNKENSMYQDMKHDAKTVAAIGIAGFLIFSLISHGNHEAIVDKLKSKV